MKIIKVNCQTCPGRVSEYRGIEIGHSYSCHFNATALGFQGKFIGHLGFGAAYDLPENPPDFCPLKDA